MSTKQFNSGWLIFQVPGSPVFEDSLTHALKAGYTTEMSKIQMPKSYRKLAEEPSQISLNNALSPIIEEFLYFNDYAITMLLIIWLSVIATLLAISTTKLYDISTNDANHLEFI